MEKSNSSINYKVAMTGVFSALSVVMSCTPLGYVQFAGAIVVTLMHIPVILVTLLAGLVPGIVAGFVFGLTSLIRNSMGGSAVAVFFMNPLVSILPRMIFPVLIWLVFRMMNKIPRMPRAVSGAVSAALGTFFHTALVMGAICVLYRSQFLGIISGALEKIGFDAATLSPFGSYAAVMASTLLTNGFLEIAAAVSLTAAVMGSIYAAKGAKSKLSRYDSKVDDGGQR